MKKMLLLAVIPALMALTGCSGEEKNYWTEDTLMHEEIFGSLPVARSNEGRPVHKRLGEGELYTPIIGFQSKDNGDGTSSVRFVATLESAITDATWTRSVHNLSGTLAKEKAEKQVKTVYTSLKTKGGEEPSVSPTTVVEKDDDEGDTPFVYFAVYCLLNIPSSYSTYYLDAFITVTNGTTNKVSKVGSVNVTDDSKYMSYTLTGENRYMAEVNGELRNTDSTTWGNVLELHSISLNEGDTLRAYSIDEENLNYTRYGFANMGSNYPDFLEGSDDKIAVKYGGTYNVFLNDPAHQFHFEKMIHFKGGENWDEWGGNHYDTWAQFKPNNGEGGYGNIQIYPTGESFECTFFVNTANYQDAQFHLSNDKKWTGYDDTLKPLKNGKDYFVYGTGWSVYTE